MMYYERAHSYLVGKAAIKNALPKNSAITKYHQNLNNKNMRKAEFKVPQDIVVEFCQELTDHSLTNEVTGTTDENEIIVEVSYDKEKSKEVDELETHLANLCEELEDEE